MVSSVVSLNNITNSKQCQPHQRIILRIGNVTPEVRGREDSGSHCIASHPLCGCILQPTKFQINGPIKRELRSTCILFCCLNMLLTYCILCVLDALNVSWCPWCKFVCVCYVFCCSIQSSLGPASLGDAKSLLLHMSLSLSLFYIHRLINYCQWRCSLIDFTHWLCFDYILPQITVTFLLLYFPPFLCDPLPSHIQFILYIRVIL